MRSFAALRMTGAFALALAGGKTVYTVRSRIKLKVDKVKGRRAWG